MREIVIVSGKGGTGKTSLAASFALLANSPVIADCDVDAADMHLILGGEFTAKREFYSGYEAVIRQEDCIACGACLGHCRFEAVVQAFSDDCLPSGNGSRNCTACEVCSRSCSSRTNAMIKEMNEAMGKAYGVHYVVDPISCEGCGVCVKFCPMQAIDLHERVCGELMISSTRCGPMVHARLRAGGGNSGKLVAEVKQEARRIAEEQGRRLIIVDGPPGIGCPVIASVSGAALVVVVAEPTVSGEHDLERVLALAAHFRVPAAVCINKWDINPEMSARIENKTLLAGAKPVGRIRYDNAFTQAQMTRRAVVEIDAPCAKDVRAVWKAVCADQETPQKTGRRLLKMA